MDARNVAPAPAARLLTNASVAPPVMPENRITRSPRTAYNIGRPAKASSFAACKRGDNRAALNLRLDYGTRHKPSQLGFNYRTLGTNCAWGIQALSCRRIL